MEQQGDEVHAETDGARAGSTPHIVRWVLALGLILAIVLLSATWITGALSMGDEGSEATTTDRRADENGEAALGDDAATIDAAPPASDVQPGMVENEASQPAN